MDFRAALGAFTFFALLAVYLSYFNGDKRGVAGWKKIFLASH